MSKRIEHKQIGGFEVKQCSRCRKWKTLDSFGTANNLWDKLTKQCKTCLSEYYTANKSRIIARQRKRNLKNPERKRISDSQSYHKRKTKIAKQKREYYLRNKESILEYQRKYKRDRSKIDQNFKLRRNIARRISWSLKNYGVSKKSKTIDLLGCDVSVFRNHIQKLFRDGMSWENYGRGGWEIDHIIPCASFDLTKEEEQKRCFHFTNTQPLWWWENLSKGHKNEST